MLTHPLICLPQEPIRQGHHRTNFRTGWLGDDSHIYRVGAQRIPQLGDRILWKVWKWIVSSGEAVVISNHVRSSFDPSGRNCCLLVKMAYFSTIPVRHLSPSHFIFVFLYNHWSDSHSSYTTNGLCGRSSSVKHYYDDDETLKQREHMGNTYKFGCD